MATPDRPAPARAVLGVLGHVDHGKTALVGALTGIDTDRLAEEKRRGISIALGFAHLALPEGVLDLVDVPGHERFVRTMVAGATGLDAVLLVVAANEGIKPQTEEHLEIASLLGIGRALVVVTKADLVDADAAAALGGRVRARVAHAGIACGDAIVTSVRSGSGLDTLRAALGALLGGIEARPDCGVAFLPIDRAFSVAGHGTVATGTLRSGALAVGDALRIEPDGEEARIRGLQVNGRRVARAEPGCRVAVNLRQVARDALPRGTVLATPGMLAASRWLSVALRAPSAGIADGARVTLLLGTREIAARVRLLDRGALAPVEGGGGEEAPAQLHAAEPVAVLSGEHFILRAGSPATTVAGGRILDPDAARLRRHDAAVLDRLSVLATGTRSEIVRDAVRRAGGTGTTLRRLGSLTGQSPALAAARLDPAEVRIGRDGTVVARAALAGIEAGLLDLLARAARRGGSGGSAGGLSEAALCRLLPGSGRAAVAMAVGDAVGRGAARRLGGLVVLVQQEREVAQRADDDRVAAGLAASLREGGLAPPDPATLAPDPATRRLLEALVRAGVAVRTTDRVQKRDVLFHRDAIEAARRVLRPLLGAPGGLLVREAGEALGISRKFSVPLLEHLDAIRFTRRDGDRRILYE